MPVDGRKFYSHSSRFDTNSHYTVGVPERLINQCAYIRCYSVPLVSETIDCEPTELYPTRTGQERYHDRQDVV